MITRVINVSVRVMMISLLSGDIARMVVSTYVVTTTSSVAGVVNVYQTVGPAGGREPQEPKPNESLRADSNVVPTTDTPAISKVSGIAVSTGGQ